MKRLGSQLPVQAQGQMRLGRDQLGGRKAAQVYWRLFIWAKGGSAWVTIGILGMEAQSMLRKVNTDADVGG